MKIGFYCEHNHKDRQSYSGVPFYMYRALAAKNDIDLTVIDPPRRGVLGRVLGRRRSSSDLRFDAIIALVSSGAVPNLKKRFSAPILHFTDATPQFLRETYHFDVPPEADESERQAIAESDMVVYSSSEMLRIAQNEYGDLLQDKARSLAYGVNLDVFPNKKTRKPSLSSLNLVWVGGDWERKGGDIAVQCVAMLRASGVDVHLTMVGDVPDPGTTRDGVTYCGRLNKNSKSDLEQLLNLYEKSHFLLSPTSADATPMIISEANAYSTPVLITDVGGVRAVMTDGVNGHFLPRSAESYAETIQRYQQDSSRYDVLSDTTFAYFHDRFPWRVWADGFTDLVRSLAPPSR